MSVPVSVVVVGRGRERLLARAVASVVGQTPPRPLEVVVVRDHPEPVPEVEEGLLRSLWTLLDGELPREVVLRQVHNDRSPGLPGARNCGVLAASHDLVAFCDEEDEWVPAKLAAQEAALVADPLVSLVTSGVTVVHDGLLRSRPGPGPRVTLEDLLRRRTLDLHPSTFLLRRADLLGPIGLVDEDLPDHAEDYDLLLRAAATGPVACVPRPLVRITWSSASHYLSHWEAVHDGLEALLAKHPEFVGSPRGRARIRGQQAVALAALGRRREAWQTVGATLRLSPREPRAFIAAAVATGAVSVEGVERFLHRRGRGL